MGGKPGMKYYDVTRGLKNGMLVYPGDISPAFIQHDAGNYLISTLTMSSHTGTHIDAPAHYLKTGDTIDTIPFGNLIGPCRVIDTGVQNGVVSKNAIAGRIGTETRVLLRTSFSKEHAFCNPYPSLGLDAAEYLVANGVRCVGIDSPSIESYNCDGSVHRFLLTHGCTIIELLDLTGVPEGDYEMIALPMKLVGLDGGPARVVLISRDGRD
jgi:arylformamidase